MTAAVRVLDRGDYDAARAKHHKHLQVTPSTRLQAHSPQGGCASSRLYRGAKIVDVVQLLASSPAKNISRIFSLCFGLSTLIIQESSEFIAGGQLADPMSIWSVVVHARRSVGLYFEHKYHNVHGPKRSPDPYDLKFGAYESVDSEYKCIEFHSDCSCWQPLLENP